ncbi:hypothetical protein K3U93_22915 [Mycobacterium malmoense]|uniref:DUF6779 domain-containing protein n=1 Tax=Mycobacterium malmoense TaxID=1780 RepID=A0ABX3SUE7_MYCMA|nr:DUF6779 domain-containing protein [Mycobacterium malmoense]ORA83977.1 hypothetical protein BST29_08335 [Mycobacterium malmoense]QZA17394.1 hypothetical protein K3U93_22915 [Mycobacterium malmoense]UNB94183.1 hypothetical protein H5T25_22895 [Mycobacterium malmoense]
MTVLSRGARVRRGGRRPGWVLLTALLVLAMGASSALVFTNRVELLKLAVILALWAAVAGAFVSVLYRRQSDADQSRVRDLKLVYDLQLDREISARREYELTVESQLRRELASELRAQAADDLAALRAELGALRTSLEILFDTDFQHHPALETPETEAPRGRAYSDWGRNGEGGPVDWAPSDRFTSASRVDGRAEETAIIDVPEEPLLPPRQPPPPREHVRAQYDVPPEARYVVSQEPPYMTQPPTPGARFEQRHQPQPEPQPQMQDWQPVAAEGRWPPPGTPDGRWAGADPPDTSAGAPSNRRRRARHSGADEPLDGAYVEPPPQTESDDRRARHSVEHRDYGVHDFAAPNEPQQPPPQMAPPSPPEPAPRHRGADPLPDRPDSPDGPPSGGQSVADLLARLQVEPSGGGRRLRREGRER